MDIEKAASANLVMIIVGAVVLAGGLEFWHIRPWWGDVAMVLSAGLAASGFYNMGVLDGTTTNPDSSSRAVD